MTKFYLPEISTFVFGTLAFCYGVYQIYQTEMLYDYVKSRKHVKPYIKSLPKVVGVDCTHPWTYKTIPTLPEKHYILIHVADANPLFSSGGWSEVYLFDGTRKIYPATGPLISYFKEIDNQWQWSSLYAESNVKDEIKERGPFHASNTLVQLSDKMACSFPFVVDMSILKSTTWLGLPQENIYTFQKGWKFCLSLSDHSDPFSFPIDNHVFNIISDSNEDEKNKDGNGPV